MYELYVCLIILYLYFHQFVEIVKLQIFTSTVMVVNTHLFSLWAYCKWGNDPSCSPPYSLLRERHEMWGCFLIQCFKFLLSKKITLSCIAVIYLLPKRWMQVITAWRLVLLMIWKRCNHNLIHIVSEDLFHAPSKSGPRFTKRCKVCRRRRIKPSTVYQLKVWTQFTTVIRSYIFDKREKLQQVCDKCTL